MRWLFFVVVLGACGDNLTVTETPDAPGPPPAPMFAQTAYVKSTRTIHDAHFGKLALAGDGRTLIAAQIDVITLYARDPAWRVAGEITKPMMTADAFGSRVAISSDGSTIAGGTYGSVYMFHNDGTAWVQEARFGATSELPTTFAVSGDGSIAAVGFSNQTTGAGTVRIFKRGATTWSQIATLQGGPEHLGFGMTLALAHDASVLVTQVYRRGATDSGVEVYVRTGDTWELSTALASPDRPQAQFGSAIACSATCDTIAIGSFEPPPMMPVTDPGGTGVTYVYERTVGVWSLTTTLAASNAEIDDNFGRALAIAGDGSTIVVGALREDGAATGINGDGANNDALYAGAAYVFRRHAGTWWQVMYLKASNAESLDTFGSEIAVSDDGTTIAVAAPYESSGAIGVGGDQTDNSQPYAGAVYMFEGSYVSARR